MDGGLSFYLAIASAAASGYGTYAAGQAQEAAAEYNADLRRMQAEVARDDAHEAAKRVGKDHSRALGRMRAQYGAQGLQETGVVTDMLGDASGQFSLELADMFTAADRRAAALNNSANLFDFEGDIAGKSGAISGFSSLAGGLSSAFDSQATRTEYTDPG